MGYRIVAGPTDMYVECKGVKTDVIKIDETNDPASLRELGEELWETIRPFVSWCVWVTHRLKMAQQRKLVSIVKQEWEGPYYPGPRPDLIAQKPWKSAVHGEWTSLPHGVVSRLLREWKGT